MSDMQPDQNQADEYRKNKDYAHALPIYEALWQQSDHTDKWLGWKYASCLRHTHQHERALEICRTVYKLDPEFSNNNNLYGWLVYDTAIKQPEQDFDEGKFIKAGEAIMRLTQQENYSPYEFAVFAVVKHYEKYKDQNKKVPYRTILDWLDKLDPQALSDEGNSARDGEEYASRKEQWYGKRTKALLELGLFEECAAFCTEGLAQLKKLHNGNDVWLRNRRAECLVNLKRPEEALPDLEYVMERKPDAWVRHHYARALQQLGRLDEAIATACAIAIPPKGLGFRWEVYLDLGNMLNEKGENEQAAKHILLAYAIRQEEGWEKVPPALQAAIQRNQLSLEKTPSVKALHRELTPFWKSMKIRPKTSHKGVISALHSNGKSGNVRADDGKTYFFGIREYKGDAPLAQDMPVGFNLKEVENKKSGQLEMHACDIYDLKT